VELRATGQVILFDGFLKVYEEGRDDVAEDEDDKRLPQVASGDALKLAGDGLKPDHAKLVEGGGNGILSDNGGVLGQQHFTQPPPRYTEATLVKRMEELGIGRPSTYASILDTIQARGYVRKDKGRLIPEDKGRLVTAFLVNYFRRYLEYDYTATLEGELDDVSAGDKHYKDVLERFWKDFSAAYGGDLGAAHHRRAGEDQRGAGAAPLPAERGRHGPAPLPQLRQRAAVDAHGALGRGVHRLLELPRMPLYPPLRPARGGGRRRGGRAGPRWQDAGRRSRQFASHWLKTGRFGPYVQLGDATEEVPKPPRASLPKGWEVEDMDLEKALMLLSLPRKVGDHPEDGEPVEAGIGRYGPYVKHGRIYANLPEVDEVFTVGMNRAVELIAAKAAGRGPGAARRRRR
jgi:DNA topoisomerase-1